VKKKKKKKTKKKREKKRKKKKKRKKRKKKKKEKKKKKKKKKEEKKGGTHPLLSMAWRGKSPHRIWGRKGTRCGIETRKVKKGEKNLGQKPQGALLNSRQQKKI